MRAALHRPEKKPLALRLIALFLACSLCPGQARAQGTNSARPQGLALPRGIRQAKYYDVPNQDKIKLEVIGNDVTNSPEGFLIRGATINFFAVSGGPPQMTAQTPECTLDLASFQINSSKLLQMRSGDGNLFVEGMGFLRQTNAPELILSNRVHTIILQPAPVGKSNAVSRTDVYSQRAFFDTAAGLLTYYDDVRVNDPQLRLSSAVLAVHLAQDGGSNHLDHIIAETNVVMDFTDETGRTLHATGERGVYRRSTPGEGGAAELLTLTGNPRLETTNGWATADVFVMNRTTGKVQGSGHCRFHGLSTMVSGTEGEHAKPPAETVISADNFAYDTKSGTAIFSDHVLVENPQLNLECEKLTSESRSQGALTGAASTNENERVTAEGGVKIDYRDDQGGVTHAISEKAVYSSSVAAGQTNKLLDLTGNPVLERTNGWVMADWITLDRLSGDIRAEGNHHTIYKRAPGRVTGDAPPAAADTEIFSDHAEFSRGTGVVHYWGGARVLDPQIHLQCADLTAEFPSNSMAGAATTMPDRIVALTNVVVDYLGEKGEKIRGTGARMVFTHTVTNGNTNQLLELTGGPVVDLTDAKDEKTRATGDKVIYSSIPASGLVIEVVKLIGHPRVERFDGTIFTSDETIIYDRTAGMVKGMGPGNHIHMIPNLGVKGRPSAKFGS